MPLVLHTQSMVGLLGGGQFEASMTQVEALASSAVRAADKLGAALIIVFTGTGRTARIVAKYRPPVPVLAVRRETSPEMIITQKSVPKPVALCS